MRRRSSRDRHRRAPPFISRSRRPTSASLGTSATRVRIIADARYVGDGFGSSIPIPAYTVVDASVRFDLGDSFGLTLKADNIFDELYATSNYYDETWMVGKPRTASVAFDFDF